MRVHRSFFVIPAALALIGGATAAVAADPHVRVAVGDLHQPAEARDFEQRVEAAATRFCVQHSRSVELDSLASCMAIAREEAVAQLSAEQQQALIDALGPSPKLANAAR